MYNISGVKFLGMQWRCSVSCQNLARSSKLSNRITMARASPIEYKMYYRVSFETVIRGHHVYKYTWTPKINEVLQCEEDTRAEAKEYDANAIGVYVMKTDDANKTLAGHVPIELSQLLSYFLQANAENQLAAQVTGKRKREVGLVVPAKFTAFTPKLRKARILERELNGRAAKYSHFELKNITISENKLPKLF